MDDTEALGVVQDYISGNNAALEEYGIHLDEVALKTPRSLWAWETR